MLVKRVILGGLPFLLLAIFLPSEASALNRQDDVIVTVPATTLTIHGRAAPNALIRIESSGSPIASLVADASGAFTTTLNRASGLQTVQISYVDQAGSRSAVSKQTISVQPQQDTQLEVFLSPTLELGAKSTVQQGGIVQFRGYTTPNAQVSLLVDGGVKTYHTIAASDGHYEFLIQSSDLVVGDHKAVARALVAADLSDDSKARSFSIISQSEPSVPDIIVSPEQLPPPIYTSPEDGATIEGNTVVIRGESVPRAQINMYENDIAIGSVFANEAGQWEFLYTAVQSPVTLSFEACLHGRCSVLSPTLTLKFIFKSGVCRTSFALETYRFWRLKTGEPISLLMQDANEVDTLNISWGDGTHDTFSLAENGQKLSKQYKDRGLYNGQITAVNEEDAQCKFTRYFSVNVYETEMDIPYGRFAVLFAIAFGLFTMNQLWVKKQESTIQKTKDKL